jgi:hypothetical protein
MRSKVPFITLVAVIATACSDAPSSVTHASRHAHAARSDIAPAALSHDVLRRLRTQTEKYRRPDAANQAGYQTDTHCVAVPGLGGMGYHYANPTLIDPTFDPATPEVMLYARNANGKLRLVAVEYIVIDAGQPAPTFYGQPFDVGGTPVPAPHWSLHVWVHRENPSGVFAPFNPTVSCASN